MRSVPSAPHQHPGEPPFVVLIGAPGSGKSRWARANFARNAIVSLDDYRDKIADNPGNQEANRYAVLAWHTVIEGRAALRRPVVVDATNAVEAHREQINALAVRWSRFAVAVIFDTPVEVCVDRNKRRPEHRRVPEPFLRETHARIRADFPIGRTWSPWPFTDGVWVVHDRGMYIANGAVLTNPQLYGNAAWLDQARITPPGAERPLFHHAWGAPVLGATDQHHTEPRSADAR